MPADDDRPPCPAHTDLVSKLDRVIGLVETQNAKLDRLCRALYGVDGAQEYGRGPTGLLGQVDRNTAWILRTSRLVWIGAAAVVACIARSFWPEGPGR